MAQRRRHLRRNVLVFLGSLIAHVGVFFLAASEFTYYPQPEEYSPPVELQIVPQRELQVPPPPFPVIRTPRPTLQPQPPSPAPAPQTQATPQPQPLTPQAPPQTLIKPSAPAVAPQATPTPTPRAAPAPATLAPPLASEVEGPPNPVPRASVQAAHPQTAAAPHLVLHRNKQEEGAPLAPSISIPGAVMAPPEQASGAPGGAPAGGGAPHGAAGGVAAGGAGLPGGVLPGFGRGLRGGILGCANADALHLSAAEKARCAEAFGEGARESPQMDPIAGRRQELDSEAATQSAADKYRDSMPSGTVERGIPGQPRMLHKPGE